jgi:hypothetical protein
MNTDPHEKAAVAKTISANRTKQRNRVMSSTPRFSLTSINTCSWMFASALLWAEK